MREHADALEEVKGHVKLQHIGFLHELQRLLLIVVPNYASRVNKTNLTAMQRAFMNRLYELESGGLETAKIAYLPLDEKTVRTRELQAETVRLENLAITRRGILRPMMTTRLTVFGDTCC